jgi:hypothetical protein
MILRLRDPLLDPASCESDETKTCLALPYLTLLPMYMPCHGRASVAVVVQDGCSTGVQLPIVCPGRVHIIEDGPRSDPKVVVCFLT